ncbi:protein of unknown function DUF985 [Fibrisoma limi BUZ 3]|uniref:DUF985 domain-containing protein n=1 Tax=Fibrisoma limi BUZ 3 TaxID=1185876 RepID=I2GQW3_9BACT|nr:cupin domain-containing protein [Fibrisoma limi]CCH56291.1 protein of unknown function DUF985 [Fibrisoma limi BUZ 3]
MNAAYWVNAFGMQPHPEGGYYAETYRSSEMIPQAGLPDRFSGSRSFSTAIYFLLENHHISALHRIQSDEVWHFYAGGPLDVFVIEPSTHELTVIRLGNNPDKGEVFQAVVPAGCWFGSKPALETEYSLVGCTVAPGFDFADFDMAMQEDMLQQFPQHQAVIKMLSDPFI